MYSIETLYGSLAPELRKHFRIDWRENRFPSKGILPRLADAILAAFRQADINHITGDTNYLAYFMRSKRTILTIHDFVSLERTTGIKRGLIWFFWYWLPTRRVAAIVVISRSTEEQLHKNLNVDTRKIFWIPNPVRAEFQPHEKKFDARCPRILQVGTKPNKNLERNARALQGIPCQFVVLGRITDAQRDHLEKHAIEFEEHRDVAYDAVPTVYQSCDILLFTSTYEGFGMPIIEAQASGLSVITSNLWSMPEVGGAGALIVDPYDVTAIRLAVRKVIGNRHVRERLRHIGFENATAFGAQQIADRYEQLYMSLLGR